MANYYGTSDNDNWTLSGAFEEAYGYEGHDDFIVQGNNNTVYGGTERDTLITQQSGGGMNTLYGDEGDDIILMASRDDIAYGGFGSDLTMTYGQNNQVYGGADDDNMSTDSSGSMNKLYGDTGNDLLSSYGTSESFYGGVGADNLVTSGAYSMLYGGDDQDILSTTSSSYGGNILHGDAGADVLEAYASYDYFYGDAGDDVLTTNRDSNTMYGGTDNDTLRATVDSLGWNELFGDTGDDTLIAEGSNNSLFGGLGNDVLITSGSNNSLSGDEDDDTLISTTGGNTLDGGAGNDQISSGTGSDILIGGGGNDTFRFANLNQSTSSNPDVITDFVSGIDKIDVTGISASPVLYGHTTAGSNRLWYSQANNNTDVMMDTTGDGVADTTIRLTGTINLVSSDFIGLVTNTPPTADAVAVSGTEDDLSIDSAVSGADIDGNPLTYVVLGTAPAGLAFNSDGTFSYIPQTLDQALSVGQSREVTFQYVANDGTVDSAPQTVTITINGVNDAPVGSAGGVSGTEDDVTIADSVSAIDVENDSLIYQLWGQAPAGLTLDSNGQFSYQIQAVDHALAAGDSRQVTFEYVANDGVVDSAPQTMTITIYGVDDATTLSGDVSATVGESGNPSAAPTSATGQITINDIDTTGLLMVAGRQHGQYGVFAIDESGQWSYQVNQTLTVVQQLTASDVVQDIFTVQSSNGVSQQITLTIQGSNAFIDNNNLDQYIGGSQDDIMYGYLGKDMLDGQQGHDSLYGGADQDTLIGGEGNDYLDGGTHIDTLIGGIGDDTYVVNTVFDKITELANEGIDTVLSSDSYQLSANLENLTLTAGGLTGNGNNLANTMTAHTLGSTLNGGGGNDTLNGNIGNDNLNGGTGSDRMIGGKGDDVYFVNGVGDQVIEFAGEGNDTIYTLVSYAVSANVENIILMAGDITAFGNVNANSITASLYGNTLDGGGGDDTLVGRQGGDVLVGGTGKDLMIGAQGDDRYVVNTRGDRVVEFAGEGHDTIESSISWTMEEHVEDLILTGSTDSVAKGNATANIITGNTGNNRLDGAGGLDRLIGGAGNDIYVLGRGYQQTDVIETGDHAAGGMLDVVEFGTGVDADQVWFAQAGNDLKVSVIGTEANILIKDWYSTGMGIEQFTLRDGQVLNANEVQQLVDQMAAFTPPPIGQTELTTEQRNALLGTMSSTWGIPT